LSAAGSDPAERLGTLVGLACHDLRTPLATVSGFAKTLIDGGRLAERDARFAELIAAGAGQLATLVDLLALAGEIASGQYDPRTSAADTAELAASSNDARIGVEGAGVIVETDPGTVRGALAALASAALRYGELDGVTWTVRGRELTLRTVTEAAAPVVEGTTPRDLGALVARLAIERLGGSIAVDGESLRVLL
jgi:signal transduction histidine kinase